MAGNQQEKLYLDDDAQGAPVDVRYHVHARDVPVRHWLQPHGAPDA